MDFGTRFHHPFHACEHCVDTCEPVFDQRFKCACRTMTVEIALSDATPVYLQLKRSYVLVQRNAKEIRDGTYSDPNVYRMHTFIRIGI